MKELKNIVLQAFDKAHVGCIHETNQLLQKYSELRPHVVGPDTELRKCDSQILYIQDFLHKTKEKEAELVV